MALTPIEALGLLGKILVAISDLKITDEEILDFIRTLRREIAD